MNIRLTTLTWFLFILYSVLINNETDGQQQKSENNNFYLIIVSDQYLHSSPLLSFKSFREQEYNVQIAACSDIGVTKDDFRNYIRNLMPAYVLLVGKYSDFPVHIIPYPAEVKSFNYYVATSTTGHPNPDIPLGLFLVENESELSNIVTKTISYENSFRNYPNEYYAHAGSDAPLPPWPIQFNEEILTEMHTKYFGPSGYNFTLATANDNTPNDVWTDINMINSGTRYIIYHGHGNVNKWSFGLGTGGLTQLTNTVYPIIFSFACLTGSFSGVINGDTTECFAQKIIASENGAVAFFGAYNTAGRGMNQLLEGAVNGLFNDSIRHRLGDVLIHAYANTNNTNTVNQYYPTVTQSERIRAAWQFHLFGDPTLKIPSTVTSLQDTRINDSRITVYPNPTTGIININSDKKIPELIIYSINGDVIFSGKDISKIDLTIYPSGMYFMSLKFDKETIYRKIIKL